MIYEWYVWLVLLIAEYCSIITQDRVVDFTEWSSFTLVSISDCTITSYFIYTVKEMMIVHAIILLFGLATPVAALDSIFDIIQDNGLDIYESFLEIANLDTFLDCYDSSCQLYTAFAPTNKAFAALNKTFVTRITTNKEYFEHLRQLMHYHLIYGCI
jgi:Fasciclin domain